MTEALSNNVWWWLDTEKHSGEWNMAADQYFVDHTDIFQTPVMRIYQWQPWCVSLGYHQSLECIDLEKCRNAGIDVVRRQTGGRAVFHAEEITYSVILPRHHVLSASVSDTYSRLSQGLAAGLITLGIPATFQRHRINFQSHYREKISASCFSAAALHEIMVDDKKLVGSAQRRFQTGVLQHGSVLIGPAHLDLFRYIRDLNQYHTEKMIRETADKTMYIHEINPNPDYRVLGAALKEGMKQTLNIQFRDLELSTDDLKGIESRKQTFSVLSC